MLRGWVVEDVPLWFGDLRCTGMLLQDAKTYTFNIRP